MVWEDVAPILRELFTGDRSISQGKAAIAEAIFAACGPQGSLTAQETDRLFRRAAAVLEASEERLRETLLIPARRDI